MSDRDVIYALGKQIAELKEQLDSARADADMWYKEAQRRIPTQPLTMEETVHALAHAEIPTTQEIKNE